MQKNYRDYTVGELLDSGLNVNLRKHGVSTFEEGVAITRMFEGIKRSTSKTTRLTTANGWRGNFEIVVFVNEMIGDKEC